LRFWAPSCQQAFPSRSMFAIAQFVATYLVHCPANYLVGTSLGIRFRGMRIGRTTLAQVLPGRLAGIARLVPVLSFSTQRDPLSTSRSAEQRQYVRRVKLPRLALPQQLQSSRLRRSPLPMQGWNGLSGRVSALRRRILPPERGPDEGQTLPQRVAAGQTNELPSVLVSGRSEPARAQK